MNQPATASRPSIRVGIVGHRYIPTFQAEEFIRNECRRILSEAGGPSANLTAVSAIAQGADSIFAEVAVSMDIPLEIVRPFERYSEDFPTTESRTLYTSLTASAFRIERLSFTERCVDAYFEAMQWVVQTSDLLIAAWDGIEGRGRGGTSDAVRHAKDRRVDWVHLDITQLSRKDYRDGDKGHQY